MLRENCGDIPSHGDAAGGIPRHSSSHTASRNAKDPAISQKSDGWDGQRVTMEQANMQQDAHSSRRRTAQHSRQRFAHACKSDSACHFGICHVQTDKSGSVDTDSRQNVNPAYSVCRCV